MVYGGDSWIQMPAGWVFQNESITGRDGLILSSRMKCFTLIPLFRYRKTA